MSMLSQGTFKSGGEDLESAQRGPSLIYTLPTTCLRNHAHSRTPGLCLSPNHPEQYLFHPLLRLKH